MTKEEYDSLKDRICRKYKTSPQEAFNIIESAHTWDEDDRIFHTEYQTATKYGLNGEGLRKIND